MTPYAHEFEVPPSAIDVLGHANNIEYVRWIQEVAVAHSRHVGLGPEEYLRIGGVFVIRRHQVEYLRPVLVGERLRVTTWIASLKRIQCERSTEITNARGEVVATGRTTWVFVDRATMRPARIPDAIVAAFGAAME